VYPGALLTDVDHFQHERIETCFFKHSFEGLLVQVGRTGCNEYVIKIKVGYILDYGVLSRIGTHELYVLDQSNVF
jgi:hypothetical protein